MGRMARTARARAGGLAKGGYISQDEMNRRDIINKAMYGVKQHAIPKQPVMAYRGWQNVSERYRIGGAMIGGTEQHYTLVDRNTLAQSDWMSKEDVDAILFFDWLFSFYKK